MLAEHIQRIEDAYDSIQALQSLYTAPHDATLQAALASLAAVLESLCRECK